MRVWIDANNCLGAGTCAEIAPDVFHERGDGLWAVKESGKYFGDDIVYDGLDRPGHGPDGSRGLARVPTDLIDLVQEAAEECPTECIHIEVAR